MTIKNTTLPVFEHPGLPGLKLIPARLPMRAKFRGLTVRKTLLIWGGGRWSEFAAFTEYPAGEAANWLKAALEPILGKTPAPAATTVPVNGTIPAIAPAEAVSLLTQYPGVQTVKIKVAEPGQSLADDVARITAIAAAAPQLKIRLDANGGWASPSVAYHAIQTILDALGTELDYVEQPVATTTELAELRELLAGSCRIAADESIRKAKDPYQVIKLAAADVAVLKTAPLGGVRHTLAIAHDLAKAGIQPVIASALESSIGLHLPAIAASLLPTAAAGLGTAALFTQDVVTSPRLVTAGQISTAAVDADPTALAAVSAPADAQFWLDRVSQILSLPLAATLTDFPSLQS